MSTWETEAFLGFCAHLTVTWGQWTPHPLPLLFFTCIACSEVHKSLVYLFLNGCAYVYVYTYL
mgnify:CR=1 FL=1